MHSGVDVVGASRLHTKDVRPNKDQDVINSVKGETQLVESVPTRGVVANPKIEQQNSTEPNWFVKNLTQKKPKPNIFGFGLRRESTKLNWTKQSRIITYMTWKLYYFTI